MRIRDDLYLIGSGRLGFDWTHPADCNVYAVDTGEGLVLIDSGTGLSTEAIVRNLADHGYGLDEITHLLLTHLHADHSGGARDICRLSGSLLAVLEQAEPTFAAGEETRIDLPRARAAGLYPADYKWTTCPVDIPLRDGTCFTIGRHSFLVLHTPGHSAFDTCYYMESPGRAPVLISGDTVMYGGKISMLNTADFSTVHLARSMERLAVLEPAVLLPGHGQPALSRAADHIRAAHQIFNNMGIPANIS